VEVQGLLDVGFIHEVYYLSWLANVVMVKKKSDKWRMCTNYTDLNKCYPKDDFPLTRIDKVVDSASGCEIMRLLDCFSGYHQTWLREEDQEKTTSHPLAPIAILGCPKVSRTPGQHSAG
jgi:hypothetical protein